MSSLTEEERVSLADRAMQLEKDEAFQKIINHAKEALINEAIYGGDEEDRERSRRFVMLLDKLPQYFQAIILDGRVVKRRLEEIEKQ